MKYSIGIDYGSLSGRCVLVNVDNGEIVASVVSEYSHAVMDRALPSGKRLGTDWALQHPQDYLDVLYDTIPKVMNESGVSGEDIIGIGIDFTACTVLPLNKDGIPLSFIPKYINNPHAYVKLWKHHASQAQADLINEIATVRNESFLKRYGGKISSEWLFPKLLQILQEDPELYDEIDCFIEACDWIVYYLTGNLVRNESSLGFKAMWSKKEGFPSSDFFKAVDTRFTHVLDKLKGEITPVATSAGTIKQDIAHCLGISELAHVSSAHMDAACSFLGAGINKAGSMLAVMGTSTCHMLLGKDEKYVPGICGYVDGGFNPGFFGYEAGQSCVGDHFQWFVENCIPSSYSIEAEKQNLSIFQYLGKLASKKRVGESGLIALDWWNGNRSILVDGQLSGVIVGYTLQTQPEDIYRSLIEATAFGTKVIIDNYRKHDIKINQLYCSGGIAKKDPYMMQIYADVLGTSVYVVQAKENAALSASILGALAAKNNGGYESVDEAIAHMAHRETKQYLPNSDNYETYKILYKEYCILHDYFGYGNNPVMKTLKKLKVLMEKDRI
ncbi:Ribulokinase [bioreactor metagenome]|uniref:Ribulokinase n=1 Tax=bioreactor metagenome TaxID=1076179 RepID=A0A644YXU2_9ZZZZ